MVIIFEVFFYYSFHFAIFTVINFIKRGWAAIKNFFLVWNWVLLFFWLSIQWVWVNFNHLSYVSCSLSIQEHTVIPDVFLRDKYDRVRALSLIDFFLWIVTWRWIWDPWDFDYRLLNYGFQIRRFRLFIRNLFFIAVVLFLEWRDNHMFTLHLLSFLLFKFLSVTHSIQHIAEGAGPLFIIRLQLASYRLLQAIL